MKIDRNNYEIFLLDYMDGTLSKAERLMVEQFLADNPDLAEELNGAKETISIAIDDYSQDKTKLYKSFADIPEITEENLEEFCIAYLENDLEETEQKKLESYLKGHPQYEKMLELHKAMRLEADPLVQFPNKSRLKRREITPLRRYIYLSGTVAAAVVVGFLLYFISTEDQNGSKYNFKLAQNEKSATILNTTAGSNHVTQNTQNQGATSEEMLAILDTTTEESPGNILLSVLDTTNEETPGSILLSVLDTTKEASPGTIQLAKVESKALKPLQYAAGSAPEIEPARNAKPAALIANYQHTHAKNQPSASQSRFINRETLLVSALKAGVKGYNRLTESELALNTEQNGKGKITAFSINSENFQMQRKIKQNNKN